MPDSSEVQAISDWLIGRGLVASDFEKTMDGFCERLVAAGVPLMRGQMSMRTLHPTMDAISFIWRLGGGTDSIALGVGLAESQGWLQSPFHHMIVENVTSLRRRLEGPETRLDFPVLEELRDQGGTDYYASLVPFDIGPGDGHLETGLISSWVTAAPEGFSDRHIAILERLIPRLALSVNANLTRQIAVNVLDAYVGPAAGRRIMGGDIHRGQVRVIRAALMFADLRGFTALSDTLPEDELVPLLDSYFDCMVAPIAPHGGHVLKFVGDGILAAFDLGGTERDTVCKHALTAAMEAHGRVSRLNESRRDAAKPVMKLDIALHLGDVFYGNVGSENRLDFTVVGPAVNEVSRIEALCNALERDILVSEAFAAAATGCADHLVSLGSHSLRGVRESQILYGVDIPAGG